MNKITVEYDGEYPNLCSGQLFVTIDDVRYKFPRYCLSSGGSVRIDKNGDEHITKGSWVIRSYPENFPENFKNSLTKIINIVIPKGCCGGCI